MRLLRFRATGGAFGQRLPKRLHRPGIVPQGRARRARPRFEPRVRPAPADDNDLFAARTDHMNAAQAFATRFAGFGQSQPPLMVSRHDLNLEIELVQCTIRPVAKPLPCKVAGDAVQLSIIRGRRVQGALKERPQAQAANIQAVRSIAMLDLGTQCGHVRRAKGMQRGGGCSPPERRRGRRESSSALSKDETKRSMPAAPPTEMASHDRQDMQEQAPGLRHLAQRATHRFLQPAKLRLTFPP